MQYKPKMETEEELLNKIMGTGRRSQFNDSIIDKQKHLLSVRKRE